VFLNKERKTSLTTFEEAMAHKTHKQPSQTHQSEKHFSGNSPCQKERDHIEIISQRNAHLKTTRDKSNKYTFNNMILKHSIDLHKKQ